MMRGLVSKALGTHEGYLGIAYLSCRELGTEKARPADIVPRAASFSRCCLEPSRLRRRAAIARKISLEIAGHSRSSRQNPSFRENNEAGVGFRANANLILVPEVGEQGDPRELGHQRIELCDGSQNRFNIRAQARRKRPFLVSLADSPSFLLYGT